MKKVFSLLLVLALTLGVFVIPAKADSPAPGGPFNSAFRVQNLETVAAKCSYSMYDTAGIEKFTSAVTTIQPGDSLYVYLPDLPTIAGGSYSAVVNCDKKVAAVVNFSDVNSGASHSGVSSPGMIWYAPGIYDNFYNYYSNIYVQNASNAAVNITVEIFAPGNSTPVKVQTANSVPANASVSFEQEGLPELATNQFYSAKISATGNIAPVVNIYGRGAVNDQLYSYNAFKSGSKKVFAPLIMNNYYGYNTALVIQNISGSTAAVTVTYTNGKVTNHTISAGAAESIYTPSSGLPAGNILYGATITSNQDVVVLVNESNAFNRAASYIGFPAGSTEVRAPIVEKNYYGYNSSVTCQNVGGSATTMTIKYAGITPTTTSPSIQPGSTHLFYQPNDPALGSVPINFITSATITAGQPIVCVVNQDQNMGAQATQVMDQLYAYEGVAP